VQATGPNDVPAAFGGLPRTFAVKPICPADVGPGLAGPELTAEFSDLAAGEVTDTNVTIGTQPPWIFFKTEAGQSCGIGPNGTVAGCDNITAEAPEGTNQTVVRDSTAASYISSDTPTFIREVDILPAGHRLDNGGATCSVGHQGTVGCTIGEHGCTIASQYGELR
jgi:hypothetical protein